MAIPNRKDLRSALVAALKADISTLADDIGPPVKPHVFAYLPPDPEGLSPFCTINLLPNQPVLSTDIENQKFGLEIGMWARRDGESGSGIDNAGAMDALDDLLAGLMGVLSDYFNAEFIAKSEPGDADIDGILYLAEFHYVEVQWHET